MKESDGSGRLAVSAYMTVEASFIIPMVLIIFTVLIYLSFYLYARCLFSQDSYILCYRASYDKREDAQGVSEAKKVRQFGTKYFALHSEAASSGTDGKWITFQGKASVIPSIFQNSPLMPGKVWTISYASRARKTDPPLDIRKFRRLRYIAGRLLELAEKKDS
ncbi:MAG: hypothetical protein LKJ76_08770 [Lachnospiraceae bacterium]|nr:hypothetical protein [Lachnospiraceae bacterium]